MIDSNHGARDININQSAIALINSWLWEGRSIMNEDARNRIANAKESDYTEDARIKDEYRKENHVLKNERSMRGDDSGARLRMDAAEPMKESTVRQGYDSSTLANNQAGPLETLEQEKIRLSRELSIRIANNEAALYALRNVINELEVKQRSMYYLRENINQSSRVQHDQVMELRRVLGR